MAARRNSARMVGGAKRPRASGTCPCGLMALALVQAACASVTVRRADAPCTPSLSRVAVTCMRTQDCAASPQTGDARLSVQVFDAVGAVVPDTRLILRRRSGSGKSTHECVTSHAGACDFESVRPGEYRLTAAANGLRTQRVEALRLGAGCATTIAVQFEFFHGPGVD
jgi:hypothetical protein